MSRPNNKGTILPVRIYGDKCLRTPSVAVEIIDDEVRELLSSLITTMYVKDGVGLAASQIGVNLRIFAVDTEWGETGKKKPLVFINPRIVSMKGVELNDEGCLSLPDIYAEVPRAKEIAIEALNEQGVLFRVQAEGLFSRALQHEFDHLNGTLFIDRISKIKLFSLKSKLRYLERHTDADGINTDDNLNDENDQ